MPISNPIQFAEHNFNIQLRRVSGDEWVGPCPECGTGDDRFHVWEIKQNFWCRQCGYSGFLDGLDNAKRMTTEDMVEWRFRQLEAARIEHDRRLSALERIHNCRDHLHYHFALNNEQMEYWLGEGMNAETITSYELGYCDRCPTDYNGRPSFTIPIYDRDGETLINIRHRIIGAEGGDKYRPHLAGLGAQLFNARFTLKPRPRIIVVEGEKKSIILDQNGFSSVAIMGQRSFKKEWLKWFESFQYVYIVLDPDARKSSQLLTALFGERGRLVTLPVKADDFFVKYGGGTNDFEEFIRLGKRVKAHRDPL